MQLHRRRGEGGEGAEGGEGDGIGWLDDGVYLGLPLTYDGKKKLTSENVGLHCSDGSAHSE